MFKIDDSMKKALSMILVVAGIILALGAYTVLAPVVLGAIANVGTSGDIPVPTIYQQAINNTSDTFAGVFGTTLPNVVGTALALLPLAVVVIVFGFILYNKYQKQKGDSAF
jgi:hypothetical protein